MPAALTVEVLRRRLEEMGCQLRQNRQGYESACPCHGDTGQQRHLYFRQGDRTELILFCHKGCEFQAILASMDLDKPEYRLSSPVGTDNDLQTWTYRNVEGNRAYQSVRGLRLNKEGEREKFYYQRRWDEKTKRWVNNLSGVTRIPYRLPELIRANPDLIVLYGEGEKTAELLATTGHPATTTSEGAGKVKNTPDLPYYLKGRRVAIFPDYDVAGVDHAKEVKAFLSRAGIICEIVRLPCYKVKTKDGLDVYDWVKGEGHSLEEVLALAEAALLPLGMPPPAVPKEPEGIVAPPPMDERAYHGLAGEIVAALAPVSESNLEAILVNVLVAFGVAVGRRAHTLAGLTRHYLNEYALLIGQSGLGKGGWWDPVVELFRRAYPEMVSQGLLSGLSSAEGLITAVRDKTVKRTAVKYKGKLTGDYEEEVEDWGGDDKRKLCVETEFGGTLINMARSGNTLSALLRKAWESGDLATTTKFPLKASGAHIGMVAHVTPDDLHQHLTPYEMANGLMNRFLIVHLTRRQLLPHGGRPVGLSPLVALLHQVLAHSVTLSLIDREPEANYMWEQVYGPLVEHRDGVAGKVIQRRRAHVLRLSATYAAFDGLPKVNTEHLMEALAVWQF